MFFANAFKLSTNEIRTVILYDKLEMLIRLSDFIVFKNSS